MSELKTSTRSFFIKRRVSIVYKYFISISFLLSAIKLFSSRSPIFFSPNLLSFLRAPLLVLIFKLCECLKFFFTSVRLIFFFIKHFSEAVVYFWYWIVALAFFDISSWLRFCSVSKSVFSTANKLYFKFNINVLEIFPSHIHGNKKDLFIFSKTILNLHIIIIIYWYKVWMEWKSLGSYWCGLDYIY